VVGTDAAPCPLFTQVDDRPSSRLPSSVLTVRASGKQLTADGAAKNPPHPGGGADLAGAL